ncbi:hypothetical protein GGS21DRAFT_522640 [Xylaria nigripes]|nr:hypothetical protein GGS21DRAFT_522640 [Xylaria nigripes]
MVKILLTTRNYIVQPQVMSGLSRQRKIKYRKANQAFAMGKARPTYHKMDKTHSQLHEYNREILYDGDDESNKSWLPPQKERKRQAEQSPTLPLTSQSTARRLDWGLPTRNQHTGPRSTRDLNAGNHRSTPNILFSKLPYRHNGKSTSAQAEQRSDVSPGDGATLAMSKSPSRTRDRQGTINTNTQEEMDDGQLPNKHFVGGPFTERSSNKKGLAKKMRRLND